MLYLFYFFSKLNLKRQTFKDVSIYDITYTNNIILHLLNILPEAQDSLWMQNVHK